LVTWFATINQWIVELAAETATDGCSWNENEKLLRLEKNDDTSKATSTHQRTGNCLNQTITLHHLWIVMNPTA